AGNVFFNVKAWPDYGKLSKMSLEEMLPIANERGNNPDDPHKRDPLDFVLWQAQAPGEPAWESPWGMGRPGWHIECSTMSSKYLEGTIDIHGGGSDLLFPHHESEIAQAEPVLQAEGVEPPIFTRFWLHTAMVHHEGEKMSKSLGNLVMARNLLKTYTPDALRLYLSSYHYRQIWSYDQPNLDLAQRFAEKLTATVSLPSGDGEALDPGKMKQSFTDALANDLDTPAAQHALDELATTIQTASEAGQDVSAAQVALRELSSIFGLQLDADGPEEDVVTGWNEHLKRFVV
ncbi:MAG: class I tRNA ligase family protein, partial [Chloroflexota bacterium]